MSERSQPQPATEYTQALNSAAQISFDDPGDFERASKGLVATLAGGKVMLGEHSVWDTARHDFVRNTSDAPASVNPSLWRQARLNSNHGLFEVMEGVWQVRGYDIANITLMAGETGWLIIDPLTNAPAAAAALRLANESLGERPVKAVIYTHSHSDHFGGILGVTSQAAVDAGEVAILAPVGFMAEVVNEFVIAGPIMGRRASYQFGIFLPPGPEGHVDCGLGTAIGFARSDLIAPTDVITETGETRVVDGIRIEFQNTPDAEAPAEMNFFFPDKRLLCMAENCTHTLHNLYPIRGAQTRDALAWSKYIQEALTMWGDQTDIMFASHHWPRFGHDDVQSFLTMQRDVYRWMHDQTMRLANLGYVPTEIAEELALPDEFTESHVQGYYGTVSHNAKSVYTKYLGWYDGNPANLNPHPPIESAHRYLQFMGGADEVLAKARAAFEAGDYRWVAQVVNHVVFAEPTNTDARELQAAALEQMGYQAESATWRNAYLVGAMELRLGSPERTNVATRDTADAMTIEQILDVMGVKYDPATYSSGPARINLVITDLDERHVLGVGHSAIHHIPNSNDPNAVATIQCSRRAFSNSLNQSSLEGFSIEGDEALVRDFFENLQVFTTARIIEP